MKRKLACFGLAFSGAELAAAYLPPPVLVPAAAFLTAGAALLWRRAARPLLLGGAVGLVYFCLFFCMAVRPALRYAGRTADCIAEVQTDCEDSYLDGSLRGTLRLIEIDGEPADVRVNCAAFPAAEPGDRFAARFTLDEADADAYRLGRFARGVYLQAEYLGGYVPQAAGRSPLFALYRARMALSRTLRAGMPRALGGLAAALLLGDKSKLTDGLSDAFRTAGVSHLLAVSGLHVSLLCGLLVLGSLGSLRFRRPMILLRAAFVLAYMGLTGLPVSVLRAGLVYLIALLGDCLLQPYDTLTATGLAAVLIGLQSGYAPCDVGFRLSFCAVLGVQAAAALERRERACLARAALGGVRGRLGACALRVVSGVQVAALAAVFTLPVLVAHGLTVSGVSVLTNLLVVWMLAPALVLGVLVLAFSWFAPLFHLFSLALAVWLKAMVFLVGRCAALPAARLFLPRAYTPFALAVLAVLALIFWRAGDFAAYLPAAALCAAAAVVFGVLAQRDVVRVALVGTAGNPCVVCTQNGRAAVLFRGGAANVRAVRDYLAGHGAPETELLVDLRTEPQSVDLDSAAYTALAEADGERLSILDGLTLDLFHNSSGGLAVLGVGDRHLAVMTGSVRLSEPVCVDVLLAGGAVSDSVQANMILFTAKHPRWLDEAESKVLLFGGEDAAVVLRPGAAMIFEGTQRYALQ